MPINIPIFDKSFIYHRIKYYDDEYLELVQLDCDKASIEGVLHVPERATIQGEYKSGNISKISGEIIRVELQKYKYEEKTIGAFEGCINLTKVILPRTVTNVTNEIAEPFGNCPLLECIELSRGAQWFSISVSNVKKIILPEGLESLHLDNCKDLEEVNLPSTLTNLYIDGCEQLKTLNYEYHNKIEDSILSIPKNITKVSLKNNKIIHRLYLHENVNSVYINDCVNLIHIDVDFSNARLLLKDGVLYTRSKKGGLFVVYIYPDKEIVRISEGVQSLSNSIHWPENMKGIILPSTLKFIYKKTFKGCNKIKNIIIPSNVEYIGSEAFFECSSLERIIILNKTPFKLASGEER